MRKPEVSRATIIKNGIANIARGSTAALVAIVLAPFLTRMMSTDAYGAWALILQMSAYTAYLDFGIQTAVGRFVAYATEREDDGYRDEIVSTSTALLAGSMVLALLLIAVLAWQLPRWFHQMPFGLYGQARIALLLVGSSLAIGLPASVFNGIFIGLQRNEVPAVIIGASRILSAALLVVTVRYGGTLAHMALVVSGINMLAYAVQYSIYRHLAPGIRVGPAFLSARAGREIFGYCFSLSIWSFATLLVIGLDTTIVGIFDFPAVAYYAVAASLIAFILGLQNAIFQALIPAAAILDARNNTSELGRMLVSTTRYGLFILLASAVPLTLGARPILTFWVGHEYAVHTALILRVLVLANVIRLSAVPYAMLLIGTGQQRLVTVSPLIEGFSNLIVSVIAGALMGAVGVAVGTVVGSAVGIACNLVYNMPRSVTIAVSRFTYLKDGVFRPLACVMPFAVLLACERRLPFLPLGPAYSFAAASMMSVWLIWCVGLLSPERARLLSLMRLRRTSACG